MIARPPPAITAMNSQPPTSSHVSRCIDALKDRTRVVRTQPAKLGRRASGRLVDVVDERALEVLLEPAEAFGGTALGQDRILRGSGEQIVEDADERSPLLLRQFHRAAPVDGRADLQTGVHSRRRLRPFEEALNQPGGLADVGGVRFRDVERDARWSACRKAALGTVVLRPSLDIAELPDGTGGQPVEGLREVSAPRVLQRGLFGDAEELCDFGDAGEDVGAHLLTVSGRADSVLHFVRPELYNGVVYLLLGGDLPDSSPTPLPPALPSPEALDAFERAIHGFIESEIEPVTHAVFRACNYEGEQAVTFEQVGRLVTWARDLGARRKALPRRRAARAPEPPRRGRARRAPEHRVRAEAGAVPGRSTNRGTDGTRTSNTRRWSRRRRMSDCVKGRPF